MRATAIYGVVWSVFVCVSVCCKVTFVSHAKTAEPIEIPFRRLSRVDPTNRVLDGVHIPMGKRAIATENCPKCYRRVGAIGCGSEAVHFAIFINLRMISCDILLPRVVIFLVLVNGLSVFDLVTRRLGRGRHRAARLVRDYYTSVATAAAVIGTSGPSGFLFYSGRAWYFNKNLCGNVAGFKARCPSGRPTNGIKGLNGK